MKNFKLKRLLGLALIGGLTTLSASTVFAAAGDQITNKATLSFLVGGVSTDLESSPLGNAATGAGNGDVTYFIEDNLVNFTVATTDGASVAVAPSATDRVLTFTVTNIGNGTQDFSLSAINSVGGADPFIPANLDAFNPASFAIYVENGLAAGYQSSGPNQDMVGYIDELAPLGAATVYIVSVIPGLPLANDALAVMTLVAQAAAGSATGVTGALGAVLTNDSGTVDDPLTEQNVFIDGIGDLNTAGAADTAGNGQHSDTSSYIVGAAVLTVTKTVTAIWDDINLDANPKMIPGHSSYVQYSIKILNDALAGASGDLTALSDTLTADLLLDKHLLNGAAAQAPTSAADDSFKIDTTNTSRPSAGISYCTAAPAIADTDGCFATVAANSAISLVFSDGVGTNSIAAMQAEGAYTEGELKPGEWIVITFNAIMP